ncbi:MAG: hypothetical protein N3E47_00555 [Candidatus Bathyarchaeota archaeon]|nr:hypothetical protein [Candidatus Bathyarchaeota archaeon]
MSRGEKEQLREREHEMCDHDWKPMGTTEGHTHLKIVCSKCGKTELIELFP